MEFIQQLTLNWKSMLMLMLMFPIVVCAVWLLIVGKQTRISAWFVALVMAIVITVIPYLIGFAGAYDSFPNLTFLPVGLTLFFGPLLYIYTYKLTQSAPLTWRKYLLVPGAMYWIYQVWAFFMLDSVERKWEFVRNVHSPYISPLETTLSLILALGAMFYSWRLYQSYRNWLPTVRADDRDVDPIWVKHFIMLMLLIGVVWIFEVIFSELLQLNYHQRFGFVIAALFIVFLSLIEALNKSHLVYPQQEADQEQAAELHAQLQQNNDETEVNNEVAFNNEIISDKEPTKNPIDWLAKAIDLKIQVSQKEWFLDPTLTLTQLAKVTGTNRTYLSRIINEGMQKNFSDFINDLRIEYAKALLLQGKDNILTIGLNSGFGSKSTFNRVFREFAGETPSQFSKRVSAKS